MPGAARSSARRPPVFGSPRDVFREIPLYAAMYPEPFERRLEHLGVQPVGQGHDSFRFGFLVQALEDAGKNFT